MAENHAQTFLIGPDDPILITGANGFIGQWVLQKLLDRGFRNLRCLVRPSVAPSKADSIARRYAGEAHIEIVKGNLLSPDDCRNAVKGAKVIIHLAAGRGEKSFPDAFLNSVITTRNLMDAALENPDLKRFVNISSFAVYKNAQKSRLLDETCPVEDHPELRGDAYSFSKIKQDQLVADYGKRFGLPYVVVRPGWVYGPGNEAITGRVGIGTFGIFLHLGGSNSIPFTYVENCAEAIALAGVTEGVNGEVFNVVDDDLPSSRKFLGWYKKNVKKFSSVYVPHIASYALCYFWEKYSKWSYGQLPPAFDRRRWFSNWRKTRYTNQKLKTALGWKPCVSSAEAFARYFEACRRGAKHA